MNCQCGTEMTHSGDQMDWVGAERTHTKTYVCQDCGAYAVFHWGCAGDWEDDDASD